MRNSITISSPVAAELLITSLSCKPQASGRRPLRLRLRTAPFLRPTDARCGRLNDEHLARSCSTCHARRTTPLGCHQEQRPLVSASECASEATTIQVDRLQYLATFANTHATLVGDIAEIGRASLG